MSKQTGLSKPLKFSDQLEDLFMMVDQAALEELSQEDKTGLKKGFISRANATKLLWAYIKARGLQSAANKKEIVPDGVLGKITGPNAFNMMQLGKFLSAHLQNA
jgi:hypothetical protein